MKYTLTRIPVLLGAVALLLLVVIWQVLGDTNVSNVAQLASSTPTTPTVPVAMTAPTTTPDVATSTATSSATSTATSSATSTATTTLVSTSSSADAVSVNQSSSVATTSEPTYVLVPVVPYTDVELEKQELLYDPIPTRAVSESFVPEERSDCLTPEARAAFINPGVCFRFVTE